MIRYMTIGLAMMTGAALGAGAVETLHAQAKPHAYTITEITIRDQDGYVKEFLPVISKSILAAGGKFIVRGGTSVAHQGLPPAPRVVVTEYESLEKAQEYWNSPSAQGILRIGNKYAEFREFVVEGTSR
jgi:uncharacterized protein (DUF1330 family)